MWKSGRECAVLRVKSLSKWIFLNLKRRSSRRDGKKGRGGVIFSGGRTRSTAGNCSRRTCQKCGFFRRADIIRLCMSGPWRNWRGNFRKTGIIKTGCCFMRGLRQSILLRTGSFGRCAVIWNCTAMMRL